MISDKKPVRDFIALLMEHDIQHVIITPGSRNAPFSISLLDHPVIKSYSVIDERSAGFIALGMAQQLAKPVVLICTSGTAALNFAPAIAEAYYQRVPLLIVTADRPIEWIDQGEGQSIRQKNVFQNYVKASCEIAEEASDGDLVWYNVRIMDEAIRLCTEGVHGPVHMNFPLRESLYKTLDQSNDVVKTIRRADTHLSLSDTAMLGIQKQISQTGKVMVLAGQMLPDNSLLQALSAFAEKENVVVLTESHSNLANENFVSTIDRLIMGFDEEQKKYIVPEILITVGHNIISRKIKEYIRSGVVEHWHVDISGEGLDTMKQLTKIIPLSPADFFNAINKVSVVFDVTATAGYRKTVLNWNLKKKEASNAFMLSAPWSDLQAFNLILGALPNDSDLQMGNSSVVRYVLLSESRNDLRYFGNRGVAGIDGCSSTAIGAAFITRRPTTLITGDIGFFYDSNAFWNDFVVNNLKIIVINNGGGGIFRIIEGPATTGKALDKFFETTHNRKADKLAEMYGVDYSHCIDAETLQNGLSWLFNRTTCAILEVQTPRLLNDVVLKDYFKFIKEQQSI